MDNQWTWQSVCPPRVMRSIFAGAVTGGLVFALCHLIGAAISFGPLHAVRYDFLTATALFVAAFIIWLVGLIAFALAPWWVFHRIGFRNLVSALVLGFAMTFLVDLTIASHLAGLLARDRRQSSKRKFFLLFPDRFQKDRARDLPPYDRAPGRCATSVLRA